MRERARSLSGSAFVFFTTLLIHGIPLQGGPILAGDGILYASLADRVMRGDWSGVLDSSRLLWTKAIFIALVASAKSVAPAGWPILIVAMNIICSAVTATLIVSFVRRATGSAAAAGVAFLFYVTSFDVYFWNWFVMTDSLYTLLATAAFILTADPIVAGKRPRSILPLASCLLLTALTRPPGAALIFPAVLGAVAFWPRREVHEGPDRQRRLLWLIVLLVMAGAVLLRTYIVRDPDRWPSDWIKPKIVQFALGEKAGEVVAGQPSTYVVPPTTYMDHFELQASRFVRFFQFLTPEFSRRHNLMNALYFVPLYALGLFAIAGAIRTNDRKRRDLVLLLLLWVAALAYYHALTVLTWRYRAPLMPELIILAACGADALRSTIASRRAVTIESVP